MFYPGCAILDVEVVLVEMLHYLMLYVQREWEKQLNTDNEYTCQ